jgi:transposase InsO family protein
MKAVGLRSIVRRKFRPTTDSKHSHPIAANLLQRDFLTSAPNTVWVSDITYIATERGWLYLTVFQDLFSRMVVGCGCSAVRWPAGWSRQPCTVPSGVGALALA